MFEILNPAQQGDMFYTLSLQDIHMIKYETQFTQDYFVVKYALINEQRWQDAL